MALTTIATSKPKMVVATQSKDNASVYKIREKVFSFTGVDAETGEALFEGPMGDEKSWDFSVEWSVDDPTTSTETCATTNGTMP
jgi:hypothetical protein